MTDKERILMAVISRIIPGLAYAASYEKRDEYLHGGFLSKPCAGDLVIAATTFSPNDFMVSFVERVEPECTVVREIGSDRLCNYSNEAFYIINKDKLGYEILEGAQYKIYRKVIKAFDSYTGYATRFKSLTFDGKICHVQARSMFKNEEIFSIEFPYSTKTSIREIGKALAAADEAALGKELE